MGVNSPNLDAYFYVDGVGGGRNRAKSEVQRLPRGRLGCRPRAGWACFGHQYSRLSLVLVGNHIQLPGLKPVGQKMKKVNKSLSSLDILTNQVLQKLSIISYFVNMRQHVVYPCRTNFSIFSYNLTFTQVFTHFCMSSHAH